MLVDAPKRPQAPATLPPLPNLKKLLRLKLDPLAATENIE
jgi:hypothetical protein